MSRARALIVLLLLLSGCAHAPREAPQPTVPLPPPTGEAAPPAQWWRLYQEPALDALVERALTQNRDLRVAAARLVEARAVLGETHAQYAPTARASAGIGTGSTLQDQIAAEGSDHVRTGPRYDQGLDLQWELDLFGRIGAQSRAARADAEASAALEDGVRVMVAAGVTQAWIRACGYGRQIELARDGLALVQRGRTLTDALHGAGAATAPDLLRAEIAFDRATAAIPAMEAARNDALTELAVLTGRPPGAIPPEARACTRLPTIAAQVPMGDALGLLRRRPDLRAAERRVAAATAGIGVAVADLYPRIALGAGEAISSPSLAGLSAQNNHMWRVGPLLSWSVPNPAAARASVRQARARETAALAAFDAAILAALKEVNQAAAHYAAALTRADALRAAAARDDKARRLTAARHDAGAVGMPAMLAADGAALEAQAALAAADLDVADAQVTLFKALGGGWEAAPPISQDPDHDR